MHTPYHVSHIKSLFQTNLLLHLKGAVVVVIAWLLDLQPPVQSLSITTNSQLTLGQSVLDTTLCDKVCQRLAKGLWFSPGTVASSTNKTDHHSITDIKYELYC